ncbi:MAG: AzlD domain-containing protein [Actinomycetota bacterium]|nr:AzlD domain-containing protein [Actinomycetota bacterium]
MLLLISGGAYAFKAGGAVLGGRITSSDQAQAALLLLPPALLTALILVWTLDGGERLVIDARLAGVAVGAVAAWRKAPFLVVVLLAAAVTAAIRAV